jgi:hypothetical protein
LSLRTSIAYDGAAPVEQDLGAAFADLAECAGDQNGVHGHGVHCSIRRAALTAAFLRRSEMYTVTNGVLMSSRSRVSLEDLMRHCPLNFSYVSW